MNKQDIILVTSILTLLVTVTALFFEKRRRISNKVRRYIEERQHTDGVFDSTYWGGKTQYLSIEEVYLGLKKLNEFYKKREIINEIKISGLLLRELVIFWPFLKFKLDKR